MAASLRELRQRRSSVQATQKITKAMELIAASRIVKAKKAAEQSLPYTRELNRAVAAVAAHADFEHPLTQEAENPRRAVVVLFTSDRGLNGSYSTNAIKVAAQLVERLQSEGKEVVRFVVGNKGIRHHNFRGIKIAKEWRGCTDAPTYADAVDIADALLSAFRTPYEDGGSCEIYAVYTRMRSMLVQEARARRVLPIEVVEEGSDIADAPDLSPAIEPYDFEPSPKAVLDQLLQLYVRNRLWFYLLECSASQLASQQRAMKAATDNAGELIRTLTREANQARQAEITQEISEIVGGASALAEATSE
ncbi:MAG: F0F1 ATP synthase subunit gamma [Arachnia propionica]|nr:MAG: F0F1 ATP synthase subunit gamma [Arachnia propionica]